jgi:hypothetical protein
LKIEPITATIRVKPCPRCNYPGKDPRAQSAGRKGGSAKVAKGFAVAGQPDAAARKRGWETRRVKKELFDDRRKG